MSDFDIDLEILCVLPKYPFTVNDQDIAADFPGLIPAGGITAVMRRLSEAGIEIISLNGKLDRSRPGSSARERCIAVQSWGKARLLGKAYWERRNGTH